MTIYLRARVLGTITCRVKSGDDLSFAASVTTHPSFAISSAAADPAARSRGADRRAGRDRRGAVARIAKLLNIASLRGVQRGGNSIRISNSRYTSTFSRRETPEVCVSCPSNWREQGMPDARCTRGLACKRQKGKRTRAYRFSGGTPTFPAQWLYGLYRALPGESGFVVSVASRKLALWPGWAFAPPLRLDANH